jgi:hypothetical protein
MDWEIKAVPRYLEKNPRKLGEVRRKISSRYSPIISMQ